MRFLYVDPVAIDADNLTSVLYLVAMQNSYSYMCFFCQHTIAGRWKAYFIAKILILAVHSDSGSYSYVNAHSHAVGNYRVKHKVHRLPVRVFFINIIAYVVKFLRLCNIRMYPLQTLFTREHFYGLRKQFGVHAGAQSESNNYLRQSV